MSMQHILDTIRSFDDILEIAPDERSEYPPLAWGDHFFYWSPDGSVPREQPFATLVTKDYPGDSASNLAPAGRWRINIHVGRRRVDELADSGADPADADVVQPHPLYARQGWVCAVVPGERSTGLVLHLLEEAHHAQRRRRIRALDRTSGIRDDHMP
ncbi:DUF6194 family protein [Brachybacterium sp. YJGR34]|uniref:DUF6194 family protein n=1 Tax=Brachybacterium sp. YJGR34 TaxID=2059911 RepID=UPI001E4D83FB|nr:DUF6194 family protein [Brachybacterium sp. YJGR34]